MPDATRTLMIPAEIHQKITHAGRGVSSRLRTLIQMELALDRPVEDRDVNDGVPVTMAVSPSLLERVEQARSRLVRVAGPVAAVPLGRILANLAIKQFEERSQSADGIVIPSIKQLIERNPAYRLRPEQEPLCEVIERASRRRTIAVAEAATGSGKGLVIAAAALAYADRGLRVALAAPTHQINHQTLKHLRDDLLPHFDGPEKPLYAILAGRSAFVSVKQLKQLLDDPEAPVTEAARVAASRWLEGELQSFQQGRREGVLRVERLSQEVPEFPSAEVAMRGPEHLEGPLSISEEVYDEQFKMARDAHIVFMTHAMLCQLVRMERSLSLGALRSEGGGDAHQHPFRDRNEMLIAALDHSETSAKAGRFQAALIDEAHDLERSFSEGISTRISVLSLRRRLSELSSKAAASAVDDAVAELRRLSTRMSGGDEINLSFCKDEAILRSAEAALKKLVASADQILKSKTAEAAADQTLKVEVDCLRRALGSENLALSVSVTFSPERQFPQILIGPRSVKAYLDQMWQGLQTGAVISATLYTHSSKGGSPSPNSMLSRLGLERDRAETHHPEPPGWLTKGVTLHIPSEKSLFKPPAPGTSAEDSTPYYEAMANQLCHIANRAAGGTLVLCTSYEMVHQLSERLHPELGSRLVVKSENERFQDVLTRYRALAAQSARPVWVATGQAWTGLDVYQGDVPPLESDQVLTDLVVTKLPFNMNRSSTELSRRSMSEVGTWPSLVFDCSILLRQGLGRLIRRRGLKDRHLWILDGRLVDFENYALGPIHEWLRIYHKRELIKAAQPATPTRSDMPNPIEITETSLPAGKQRLLVIKRRF